MDEGAIQQIGTPEEVYRRPANRFVATFLGRCNVIEGVVRTPATDGTAEIELGAAGLRLVVGDAGGSRPEQAVSVVVRPEAIRLVNRPGSNGSHGAPSEPNLFDVVVSDVSFLGDHYEYQLEVGDLVLIAHSPHQVAAADLKASVEPGDCRLV
jgi:iron(III) transport system ATP-binding protein